MSLETAGKNRASSGASGKERCENLGSKGCRQFGVKPGYLVDKCSA